MGQDSVYTSRSGWQHCCADGASISIGRITPEPRCTTLVRMNNAPATNDILRKDIASLPPIVVSELDRHARLFVAKLTFSEL